MALKINFKDFKAQFPFRFKIKATKEEANKLLSGIESNMDILPDFEVEEGTEVNSAFFKQLEQDINADQVRQDEEFRLAIGNIEVPVTSVNDKTGAVMLTAGDVGAVPTARKVNNKALSADITLDKADVGLSNVLNYGIATTAEAQAGVANNRYVTPALVKAAVQHLATTGEISMVKSVQRGQLKLTAPSVIVPIPSINNKKIMVLLDGNSQRDSDRGLVPCLGVVTNTSIEIKGGHESGGDYVSWQVIEFY